MDQKEVEQFEIKNRLFDFCSRMDHANAIRCVREFLRDYDVTPKEQPPVAPDDLAELIWNKSFEQQPTKRIWCSHLAAAIREKYIVVKKSLNAALMESILEKQRTQIDRLERELAHERETIQQLYRTICQRSSPTAS